jgi:hypothetical protein
VTVSVAVTVALKGPPALGMPEIVPVDGVSDTPVGKPVELHVTLPDPPAAAKVTGP